MSLCWRCMSPATLAPPSSPRRLLQSSSLSWTTRQAVMCVQADAACHAESLWRLLPSSAPKSQSLHLQASSMPHLTQALQICHELACPRENGKSMTAINIMGRPSSTPVYGIAEEQHGSWCAWACAGPKSARSRIPLSTRAMTTCRPAMRKLPSSAAVSELHRTSIPSCAAAWAGMCYVQCTGMLP